jgi:hypothetical protein
MCLGKATTSLGAGKARGNSGVIFPSMLFAQKLENPFVLSVPGILELVVSLFSFGLGVGLEIIGSLIGVMQPVPNSLDHLWGWVWKGIVITFGE